LAKFLKEIKRRIKEEDNFFSNLIRGGDGRCGK
jgi:hypothetical protein